MAPSDPVHIGAANRGLERLGVPWRFGGRHQTSIDASGNAVATVTVTDRYELIAQAGAESDTLAAAARAPWIVAGPGYVLVGSPLIATASALPVRADARQCRPRRRAGEGGRGQQQQGGYSYRSSTHRSPRCINGERRMQRSPQSR